MKLNKWASITLVFLIGAMTVIGLSGLIFLVPHESAQKKETLNNYNQKENMENITIQTSDGVTLNGDYYTPNGQTKGWVLYLHMMSSTKESYAQIAKRMQRVGFAGLSIDLRGHGKSQDGPDGYKTFSDKQHQNSINDVIASINFLKEHGAEDSLISIVGASIGANLAIDYASINNLISNVVVLSPGLNYHGIRADIDIKKLNKEQNILLVGSKDDSNVNEDYKQIDILKKTSGAKSEVKIYDNGGHGTDILEKHPDLEDNIVGFIVK